jgi:Ca2+-binding EF-hand superfamily protein
MDDDNSKSVDTYEFTKAIKDYRVNIPENQIQLIFSYIDRNRSGTIDYEEFLRAVRGNMNQFRRAIVV